MIVRYSDYFAIQLEELFFAYADAVLNISRKIALLTEKEFRLQYSRDQVIRFTAEDGNTFGLFFRISGNSVILDEIKNLD